MLNKLIEILISMIVLLPVFGVLNSIRFHSTRESLLYYVFASYLSAVYLFVGMPTLQFVRFELSLTLIPFLPMIYDFKNTLLNIILFVPLGIMLPCLWKKYKNLRTVLMFSFGLSLSIELLQVFTYRATDINDIITNTCGALLGFSFFKAISHIIPSVTKFARRKNEVFTVILAVFAVMFFIQPYLAELYFKIT